MANYGSSEYREAMTKISNLLTEISHLYAEAQEIADLHDVSFSYNGPSDYGDGGCYEPSVGWLPSSQSC